MLNQAQKLLTDGFRLRIWDALARPCKTKAKVQHQQLQAQYPDWPKSTLRRQTHNQMLFPIDVATPPPHSTGSAVDLTIVDEHGKDLDMMSPFTQRYQEAITSSKKITPTAQKNRRLLFDVMTKTGFTNYSYEWWHYSYGESAWALRLGRPYAIFDRTQPDEWRIAATGS